MLLNGSLVTLVLDENGVSDNKRGEVLRNSSMNLFLEVVFMGVGKGNRKNAYEIILLLTGCVDK